MRDLVDYIIKQVVNNPDDIMVEEQADNDEVRLKLSINPEDMGIVIGKGGQTIKAIRKLLMVRSRVENIRVYLDIIEPDNKAA